MSSNQNKEIHDLKSALDRLDIMAKLMEKGTDFASNDGQKYLTSYRQAVAVLRQALADRLGEDHAS